VLIPSGLLAAAAALVLAQQSWEPFPARREVSPNGRHYVVLRPKRTGDAEFDLVRRREGVPPIAAARYDLAAQAAGADPRCASVDPKDVVLARNQPVQAPVEVRVLDGEPAVVLLEKWGAVGAGEALRFLSFDPARGPGLRWSGTTGAWELRLRDFFGIDEIKSFPRQGGDVWWWQAWWVDEARGVVVLVAAGDLFVEVALSDGKPRRTDASVLLTRVLAGTEEERVAALDLAVRLLPEGIVDLARRAAADEAAPLAVRVRAALALRRKGVESPAATLFRAATARGQPSAARTFAVRHLAEVLGEEALPLLRDVMRGEADDAWHPAMEAFAELGDKAVPALVKMLGEMDQSRDYRGGAAHVLGALRAETALPALWKAALAIEMDEDDVHFVPGAAMDAILEIGPADLRPRLLELLEKGSPHDARIAQWLEAHPGKDAAPALRAALPRWPEFSWERKRIAAALKACGE
jgi:hypothetical protein